MSSGPPGPTELPTELTQLPAAAYATALACLPGVGSAWLVHILARYSPERAWELVAAGELSRPPRARPTPSAPEWTDTAARTDVASLWTSCQHRGIAVTWPGAPGYPTALAGGPEPAGVLFTAGRLDTVEGKPCVAIVGTRRCTPDGAAAAYQLAYDLSSAGACVISGLALGIDGAAHAGALAAARDLEEDTSRPAGGSTVGVAASGVDVAYPRRHEALWREVVGLGAVVSETPPGCPAQAWRFPPRNRLIAGLARMVVVVESHAGGGSWHTVEAALRRGVEVGAVPGSIHSSASVGTNTLLHEGATPVRGAQDVLDALGLLQRPPARSAASDALSFDFSEPGPASPLGTLEDRVRTALSWRPLCLEEIVERSGVPVGAVVVALDRLEQQGVAGAQAGWWFRKART